MSHISATNERSLRSNFVTFWLIYLSVAWGLFWLITSNETSVVYAQSIPQVSRTVMPSPFVKEFDVPIRNFAPTGLTVDSSNNVWFAGSNRSVILTFFPKNESFKEYPFNAPGVAKEAVSTVAVSQLVYDEARKRVWFTWADSNSIGELNTETGQVKLQQIPTKNSGPFGILIGPDDAIWFTELFGEKIGRLDPSTGRIIEYFLPSRSSGPIGPALLTVDSEGRIWFTEAYGRRIGAIDLKAVREGTSDGIREYEPPYMVNSPIGVAVSKGVVWFTDHASSIFSMFVPANNTWKQFWVSQPPPEANFPDSLPNQLLIDQDNLWMAEHVGNRMAKFDPSRGLLTEYEVPTRPLALTLWLALDHDGNLWFTESATNKIGFVNASTSTPFAISASSDALVVEPSESASLEVRIKSPVSSALNYSLSGMTISGPRNLTYQFTRGSLSNPPGVSVQDLTIRTQPSLSPGRYSLLISASDGLMTQSKTVELVVKAEPFVPQIFWLIPAASGGIIAITVSVYVMRKRRHLRGG